MMGNKTRNIIINSIEDVAPYYNKKTNTYEFLGLDHLLNVEFKRNLFVESNIIAGNIIAKDLIVWDINALDITARDITSSDIIARDIITRNIIARDIITRNINSHNIYFYAICYSYHSFICNSIHPNRKNSNYFCLDSDVIIKSKDTRE